MWITGLSQQWVFSRGRKRCTVRLVLESRRSATQEAAFEAPLNCVVNGYLELEARTFFDFVELREADDCLEGA